MSDLSHLSVIGSVRQLSDVDATVRQLQDDAFGITLVIVIVVGTIIFCCCAWIFVKPLWEDMECAQTLLCRRGDARYIWLHCCKCCHCIASITITAYIADESGGAIGVAVDNPYRDVGRGTPEDPTRDLENGGTPMKSPSQKSMGPSGEDIGTPEEALSLLESSLRSGKVQDMREAVRLCSLHQVRHPELQTARSLVAREREQAATRLQAEERKKRANRRVEELARLQQEALFEVKECLRGRDWKGLREAILKAEHPELYFPRRHPELERARSVLRAATHAGFAEEDDFEMVRITIHPSKALQDQMAYDAWVAADNVRRNSVEAVEDLKRKSKELLEGAGMSFGSGSPDPKPWRATMKLDEATGAIVPVDEEAAAAAEPSAAPHVLAEAERAAAMLQKASEALEAGRVEEAGKHMEEYNNLSIRASPESVAFSAALEKQGWPVSSVVKLQERTRTDSALFGSCCTQREKPPGATVIGAPSASA